MHRVGDIWRARAFYTVGGVGFTPVATCTILDPGGAKEVDALAASSEIKAGWVYYLVVLNEVGDWGSQFETADATVDQKCLAGGIHCSPALTTDAAAIAAAVWAAGARTLTSFGTLVADVVAGVFNIAYTSLATVGSIGALLVERLLRIGAVDVTYTGPVADDGSITITRSDCYRTTEARQLTFLLEDCALLSAWTIVLRIDATDDPAGQTTITATSKTVVGADLSVVFEITSAQAALIPKGAHRFEIEASKVEAGPVTSYCTPLTGIATAVDDL